MFIDLSYNVMEDEDVFVRHEGEGPAEESATAAGEVEIAQI